ncbi:MAG: CBS domain-containing protein [Saprospirales bacterium]|nr:CBS domain-containing protein [Saprospirales bacterium]MBK8493026.1 CBS domain-containing protein [Saprospirales bacterium]
MILDKPVSEIMRRHVLTIKKDFSFSEACRLFFRMGIHHLPVVDEKDHLLGMLSTHDALRAFALRGHLLKNWNEENVDWSFPVEELMSIPAISVSETDSMDEAVRLCATHHIQSLPVLKDGQLVGMVTSHDIMQYLANSTPSNQPA